MRTYGALSGVLVPLAAGLAAACGSDSPGTDTAAYTVDKLQDPTTCKECHVDHFNEWSQSMHAYASTDPVFRAMNDRGQKETNGALGDFCVKCHAPMAVATGATHDGSNLDSLPAALQGVTCYFCHNVTSVADTHNNPLVLAKDQTMRGGIRNPLKYKGHAAEYSKLYDDNAAVAGFDSSHMCGSCHDIVVPAQFSGATPEQSQQFGDERGVLLEQTFTEWGASIFADPMSKVQLNCTSGGGCHMDRQLQVPIASPPDPHPIMPTRPARHRHNFPAIDVALTGDPAVRQAELAAVEDKLSFQFRVEICADPPPPRGMFTGAVNVTIENLSAGHNYPSGASQDRRSWVELHAYKDGKELMSSGVVPPGTPATTVDGTWLFYDKGLKADGQTPAHMFWDVAALERHTIPVSTYAMPNQNLLGHSFTGAAEPDRVTVTIWVEPIGLDVIDDMLAKGYLDQGTRDAIPRIAVSLGGPQLDPAGTTPVTFDWTSAKAESDGYPGQGSYHALYCLQNTNTRFQITPPAQ